MFNEQSKRKGGDGVSKVNMETLLPFIEEAFNRNLDFEIPVTGTSMNPLLYQNRDFVKIVKPVLPLKIGDIPLYRRNDGTFVLHRVVGIKENGEYIMCGDNQFLLEYGITDKNIIGVAKTLVIDGRKIDVDGDTHYLKHKEKYIKNVGRRYPARRLRYKLGSVKRKLLKNGDGQSTPREPDKEVVIRDIVGTGEILVGALRAQITHTDFYFPENTDFEKLLKLAYNHRVTAMAAPEVMKCGFVPEKIKGVFSKEIFKSTARYTAQENERRELSEELSRLSVRHCFLKGAKVGEYYDNPEFRFMLDMDLYVEPEKFETAEELLISRGYEINSNSDDKDTCYVKKPFLIVELHKELKYDYDKGYEYYKGAFGRMIRGDGSAVKMTDEDFYVYILSHTAHHFETAGTGIKSVIDHYYLREKLKPKCNPEILENSLNEIGLKQFSERLDALCDFWFKGEKPDSPTEEMSRYILLSGVFGNGTNSYLNGIVRGDYGENADSYFIKRLLPPLGSMKNRYPVLKKMPVLLPLFWIVRILSSVFSTERIARETKTVVSAGHSEKEKQKRFFDDMGL